MDQWAKVKFAKQALKLGKEKKLVLNSLPKKSYSREVRTVHTRSEGSWLLVLYTPSHPLGLPQFESCCSSVLYNIGPGEWLK